MSGELVVEGSARIVTSVDGAAAFYNPLAKDTRSLGVAILAAYAENMGRVLSVADALAATGVRGIRYFLESDTLITVYFNDRSSDACKVIRRNVEINDMSESSHIEDLDANLFLNTYRYQFDFIDIDPFGTPSPFIDTAISTVRDGGLVAYTATDLAPLCGIYPKTSLRKYGSVSRQLDFSKEVAVRILIKEGLAAAGRHARYCSVVSGHVISQYARIYLLVYEGKRAYPLDGIGYILRLRSGEYEVVPAYKFLSRVGEYSGDAVEAIGPLWIGPLHDREVIRRALDLVEEGRAVDEAERRRVIKLLRLFLEEAEMPPYYYDVHRACKKLGIPAPRMDDVIGRLREIGYRAVKTHFSPVGVKTDAPYRHFLYVLR
jgi:tRNA (guanine26-N2/guanine27-N2)-dimethyltransferase